MRFTFEAFSGVPRFQSWAAKNAQTHKRPALLQIDAVEEVGGRNGGIELPANRGWAFRNRAALLPTRMPSNFRVGPHLARLGKGEAEAGWRDLAHVLLYGNELIYVD